MFCISRGFTVRTRYSAILTVSHNLAGISASLLAGGLRISEIPQLNLNFATVPNFAMMDVWLWASLPLPVWLSPIPCNILFSPLRHYLGPWMAGATSWWGANNEVYQRETFTFLLCDLRQRYGEAPTSRLILARFFVYPRTRSVLSVHIGKLSTTGKASFRGAFCPSKNL